jgi:Zn-dependent metalloprotease
MAQLEKFFYHAVEGPPSETPEGEHELVFRGAGIRSAAEPPERFSSDEAAARFHLSRVLASDPRPTFRGVVAPERAGLVPDLKLVDTQDLPQTNTRLVRFEQTYERIPIFGSRAVCELDDDRNLVSAEGAVDAVRGVKPLASVSAADALEAVAEFTGAERSKLEAVAAPVLNFFKDPNRGDWHLVYHFTRVPAPPRDYVPTTGGHGLAPTPRALHPLFDYLVDAHRAEVVYSFSSTPLVTTPAIVVWCKGVDEDDREIQFFGNRVSGQFEMRDPSRRIATHDLGLQDLDDVVRDNQVDVAKLGDPIRNTSDDWADTARGAISAHANASIVYRFYKSILDRNSIDNNNMAVVNVVNCVSEEADQPPNWRNACWYCDQMWYGQAQDEDGRLVSFSRFLDVIAHELTHGVTQFSSNLVYDGESGALNESFSDIFGAIIRNWDWSTQDGGDVSTWIWEIGSGLGENGLPIRDMSDPSRTKDPDHMGGYVPGGDVHVNSNIHNKAAYNLITATDENGRVFTPQEAAYLYYLTLVRLTPLATFSDVRRTLISVASTMYGDDDERVRKVAAIGRAYDAVGID